jgi:hypothetical protein
VALGFSDHTLQSFGYSDREFEALLIKTVDEHSTGSASLRTGCASVRVAISYDSIADLLLVTQNSLIHTHPELAAQGRPFSAGILGARSAGLEPATFSVRSLN